MPKYLILPIETPSTFAEMSPQDMQRIVKRYTDWTMSLGKAKRLDSGHQLADGSGRVLRGTGDKVTVTDRMHTESKELIGGFWIIKARDYGEAEQLCRDCPHLEYGPLVVREILEH